VRRPSDRGEKAWQAHQPSPPTHLLPPADRESYYGSGSRDPDQRAQADESLEATARHLDRRQSSTHLEHESLLILGVREALSRELRRSKIEIRPGEPETPLLRPDPTILARMQRRSFPAEGHRWGNCCRSLAGPPPSARRPSQCWRATAVPDADSSRQEASARPGNPPLR